MKRNSEHSSPHPAVEAAEKIKDSAQQIWLAGLGAFAKAQQEGGKVFESLVADGLNLQRKTQATAQAQMAEASQKIGSLTGGLSSRAGQQWDRLEGIFEDRVARALERLNMASRADLDALQQRLDALELQVRALREASAPAQRPTRPKIRAAAKKPARTTKRGTSAG